MTNVLDWAIAHGSYLFGLGTVVAMLAGLFWADHDRPTVRNAIYSAIGSFAGGLALAYLDLSMYFGHRSTANAIDYLLFRKVSIGATPLIAAGYAFLAFAPIAALFPSRAPLGGRAERRPVPSRSTVESPIASRAFASVGSHFDGSLSRPSLSEALGTSFIRLGFLLGYLIALVPGAIAVYFLDRTHGEWPIVVAAAWLIAFTALAVYLHRRGVMQLTSSAFCVVAVIGAAAYLRP